MLKRIFDIILALFLITILFFIILITIFIAAIDTKSYGLFLQKRVGKNGILFNIFKIRTLNFKTNEISKIGFYLRKSKLDELPQLANILFGQMSFVGPRPDVEGYYDLLIGEERKILELKPGLTSLASIKYSNEDEILKKQTNPLKYNDEVIFPDKVKMNLDYYYNRSFFIDLKIILKTIFR